MNSVDHGSSFATRPRTGMIFLFILVSLVISHVPVLNWLISPITTFIAGVHEMSHAFACLLTGGHVTGMTIVSDGEGHGGLTMCRGGLAFVWTQAGYMGTALFGCLLILLGRMPKLSKPVLFTIGLTFGLASLTFMFGSVLHGSIWQGITSMVCGLAMAAAFMWVSMRLSPYYANLLLLFLGVQTSLNSINSITWLFNPAGWSDADIMAQLTGIPAVAWSCFWLSFAVITLGGTLWWSYKADNKPHTF